jgi:hypothetical protein
MMILMIIIVMIKTKHISNNKYNHNGENDYDLNNLILLLST